MKCVWGESKCLIYGVPVFKELIPDQIGVIQDSCKYHKTIERHRKPRGHREVSKEEKITRGKKSGIEGPQRIKISEGDNIFELLH